MTRDAKQDSVWGKYINFLGKKKLSSVNDPMQLLTRFLLGQGRKLESLRTSFPLDSSRCG